jgi:oligopeptide/dipeptide ABC transporter ATP-binding protein
MTDPILQVRGLRLGFPSGKGHVQALRGVDLELRRGEVLGLVGESGCGKSTLARAVMQLARPYEGSVLLEGTDLGTLSERQLRPLRRHLQMVFQDPYASLNPRMSIGDILAEPQLAHGLLRPKEAGTRCAELLDMVGLPAGAAHKYPHEFSGGQRQRVAIARALALGPSVLIADEPVSALDVSIQAQIINLLQELVARLNLSMLFIAHDLSVVKHISDRIAVMYLGRIVELGEASAVIETPRHPYTRALVASIPVPDPTRQAPAPEVLAGDPPSPLAPPRGCAFHSRCPRALERCRSEMPELEGSDGKSSCACFNP